MTDWSHDLSAAPDDIEVQLACLIDREDDQCIIQARRHAFPTDEMGVVVWRWQSTWDAQPVPDAFRPYAWADMPTPPDPGGA